MHARTLAELIDDADEATRLALEASRKVLAAAKAALGNGERWPDREAANESLDHIRTGEDGSSSTYEQMGRELVRRGRRKPLRGGR